jgi:ParB-like chromosome segregation protein Spo0J
MALVENGQREADNAIERAEAEAQLMEMNGWTQRQLSLALGEDEATISRRQKLRNYLDPKVREKVRTGELRGRTAYELAVLSKERQLPLAERAIAEKLTADQVRGIVKGHRARSAEKHLPIVIDGGIKVSIAAGRKKLDIAGKVAALKAAITKLEAQGNGPLKAS